MATVRKVQVPCTLPDELRAEVEAMAAAEHRSRAQMIAILVIEGLDAREALPQSDRVVALPVPRAPVARRQRRYRVCVLFVPAQRARVALFAAAEQRSQDQAIALLAAEGLNARKRKSARKSA